MSKPSPDDRAPRRESTELRRGLTYAVVIETDRCVAWVSGVFEGYGDMRRDTYTRGDYLQFDFGRLAHLDTAGDAVTFTELLTGVPQ